MADRDVTIDIIGRDKTSKAAITSSRALGKLNDQVRKVQDTVSKATGSNTKFGSSILKASRAVAGFVAPLASVVSLVGPLSMGLIAAGKAAVVTGKAIAGMAPLAAFIPSLVGSVGLLVGTLKLAGPSFLEALTPITDEFFNADKSAGNLTKRIGDLATKGVTRLAEQFAKVNLPTIGRGMESIARSTNRVVLGVGKWINSIPGQGLIRTITEGTSRAADKLAPKITAAAIALGNLAIRAGDKGITGLADLIGRVLDRFTAWANSTSWSDIRGAMDDLRNIFIKFREVFTVLREVGAWMGENAAKVKAFSTVLAGVGVVLGIISGNPIAIIIGLFTLLVTHWEWVKGKFNAAKAWWSETWNKIKNDPNLVDLGRAFKEHFNRLWPVLQQLWTQLKTAVIPALKDLWKVFYEEVIPAFTAFVRAVSPIVVWFVKTFGPQIITAVRTTVRIVTGLLRIIAGIFNVITALITGDWSRAWKGVKQIVGGAVAVVVAIVRGLWETIKRVFSGGVAGVVAVARTLKGRILGALAGAAGWLVGIGRSIGQGLANGIRGAYGSVSGAVSGLVGWAKSKVPAMLRPFLPFASAGSGWRPAQFAAGASFAMAGAGGTSRVGGPVQVNSRVDVSLDGAPFHAMTVRVVNERERRKAWRDKVGER